MSLNRPYRFRGGLNRDKMKVNPVLLIQSHDSLQNKFVLPIRTLCPLLSNILIALKIGQDKVIVSAWPSG